jgi:hypothetical protein
MEYGAADPDDSPMWSPDSGRATEDVPSRLDQWAELARSAVATDQDEDSSRTLRDLAAALTVTMRMVRRYPLPNGLSVLSVASDRALIDEAQRLRDLADREGGGGA